MREEKLILYYIANVHAFVFIDQSCIGINNLLVTNRRLILHIARFGYLLDI